MRKSTTLITLGICLILCLPLLPVAAYVGMYFMPHEYTSQVTMELRTDSSLRIEDQSVNGGWTKDPQFVASQIKRLQSREILYPVIDQLDLMKTWSNGHGVAMTKEQAFLKLLAMMHGFQRVRNTDFVVIPVTSADPMESANIANAIATTYQKIRREDDIKERLASRPLTELKAEVDELRVKVQKAADEAQEFRQRLANPEDMMENSDDVFEEAKLNDAKQKVEDWKNRQAQIEKMPMDELMNALPALGLQDPTISDILPKYQAALTEEAELKASVGPEDPRLKTLHAKIVAWKKQLNDELDAVQKNVQTQLAIAQGYLNSQQEIYDKTHDNALNPGNSSADYLAVKQNYLSAKKLLDSESRRYEAWKAQLQTSYSGAPIWDKAKPATTPSSPNILHVLIAAAGAGFLCALCGTPLLIKGLRLRRREAVSSV